MTEKQNQVVEAARERLKDRPWFKGICLDNLDTDEEIDKDFEECVEALVTDTIYWDGEW
jgi:hypothetical protein